MHKVFSGREQDTFTSSLFQAAGMSTRSAHFADGGLSLCVPAAAVFGRTTLAKEMFSATVPLISTARLKAAAEYIPSEACNRLRFEKYLTGLRGEMGKPYAKDLKLQYMLDEAYRKNATVGSGSTAAAIREELRTGFPIKGTFHSQKGRNKIIEFQRWLRNNPTASSGDRVAAENVIKDLINALGE